MTTYKLEVVNVWPASGHENWSDVECQIRASDGSVIGSIGFNDWPGDPADLHNLPCDRHGDYLFREEPLFFEEIIFPLQIGTRVADATPRGVMVSVFDYRDGSTLYESSAQCRPATAEEAEQYWKIRVQLEVQASERERFAAECDWSI